MLDALDAFKLVRMQGLRQNASRPVVATPALTHLFGGVKSNPTPKNFLPYDLFQKASQPGPVPKGGRIAETKPSLEKSAPSGGLGGFFQTLKSNWLSPVTVAPVQQPTPAFQEAAKKVNPAANPFKTMEAILLAKTEDTAGLQNPALRTQSLNGTKPDMSKKPINGLAAVAMPLVGIGLLTVPVLAPTALVVKPGLLNPLVTKLPGLIP